MIWSSKSFLSFHLNPWNFILLIRECIRLTVTLAVEVIHTHAHECVQAHTHTCTQRGTHCHIFFLKIFYSFYENFRHVYNVFWSYPPSVPPTQLLPVSSTSPSIISFVLWRLWPTESKEHCPYERRTIHWSIAIKICSQRTVWNYVHLTK